MKREIKTIRAHEVKIGDELVVCPNLYGFQVGEIVTTPKGKLLFHSSRCRAGGSILGCGVDPKQRVHIVVDNSETNDTLTL